MPNSAYKSARAERRERSSAVPRPPDGIARIGTEDVHFSDLATEPNTSSGTPAASRPFMSLFDEMSNVTALKLLGGLTPEMEEKLITTPAPALQRLVMYATLAPGKARYREAIPVLFAGQHPNLTSLAMGNFARLGDNNFANLKQLQLSRQLWVPEGMLSLAKMLNSSPDLEELGFTNTGFHTDPTRMGSALPDVYLPRLKRMMFKNIGMGYASTLLGWIRLSTGQPVALRFSACGAGIQGVWHETLDHLQDFFDLNPYGILDHVTKLRITMRSGEMSYQDECSLVLVGPEHSVTLSHYASTYYLSKVLRKTFNSKPIEELWIESSISQRIPFQKDDSDPDRKLLEMAGKIRKLHLNVTSASLRLLCPMFSSKCPVLQELHIKLPWVTTGLDDVSQEYVTGPLQNALKTRAARGLAPIPHIHLYPPRFAEEERNEATAKELEAWRAQIQTENSTYATKVTIYPPASEDSKSDTPESFPRLDLPPGHEMGVSDAWKRAGY